MDKRVTPKSNLPKVFTIDKCQNEEPNEAVKMCAINCKPWTNNWIESEYVNNETARKILNINLVTLSMCLLNIPFMIIILYLQELFDNHEQQDQISTTFLINITFLSTGVLFFIYFFLTEKRLKQYLDVIVV